MLMSTGWSSPGQSCRAEAVDAAIADGVETIGHFALAGEDQRVLLARDEIALHGQHPVRDPGPAARAGEGCAIRAVMEVNSSQGQLMKSTFVAAAVTLKAP